MNEDGNDRKILTGGTRNMERKFEGKQKKAGDAKTMMLARMPTRIFSRKSGLRGKPSGI